MNDEAIVDSDNRRFECAFSKKAIRHNTIVASVVAVPTILLIIYVGFVTSQFWILLALASFMLFLLVYSHIYMSRLAKESYIGITSAGILKYRCKGRKEMDYPVNQIKSIEKATLEEAKRRYARFPVVINTKGQEVYPEVGVLITFNRAWIKSVFPVYFNPADPDAFISAIEQSSGRF